MGKKGKSGSFGRRPKAPLRGRGLALARRTNVRNVDGAGIVVESATYLHLLADELFGFLLIVQLVVHVTRLQHIFAPGLYYGSRE